MGSHFDTLVSVTRLLPLSSERDALERRIRDAALFEFPIASTEVRPQTGLEKEEFGRLMHEYWTRSQHYGNLMTPFPVTAIEDLDSIVIMEQIVGNEYRVTDAKTIDIGGPTEFVSQGRITIESLGAQMRYESHCEFTVGAREGKLLPLRPSKELFDGLAHDLATAARTYLEELVYIMDPRNFIVEMKPPEAQRHEEQIAKLRAAGQRVKLRKREGQLRKTVVRPRYIALAQEDLLEFYHRREGPRAVHPVRGYWRWLRDERYTHARDTWSYTRQHFRGEGTFTGRGRVQYRVWVKDGPGQIRPHDGGS